MDNRNNWIRSELYTEWTCQHCPNVATTIREGLAVCSRHRARLGRKLGWAERLLGGLLS